MFACGSPLQGTVSHRHDTFRPILNGSLLVCTKNGLAQEISANRITSAAENFRHVLDSTEDVNAPDRGNQLLYLTVAERITDIVKHEDQCADGVVGMVFCPQHHPRSH